LLVIQVNSQWLNVATAQRMYIFTTDSLRPSKSKNNQSISLLSSFNQIHTIRQQRSHDEIVRQSIPTGRKEREDNTGAVIPIFSIPLRIDVRGTRLFSQGSFGRRDSVHLDKASGQGIGDE